MPELHNGRLWYGADDGRQSADFGTDPRSSDMIGTHDHDERPRHHRAELDGPNGGGFPRNVDDRRTHTAIAVPLAAGLLVSGRSFLCGISWYSITVVGLPANRAWVLLSDGVPVFTNGFFGNGYYFSQSLAIPLAVNNLSFGAWDTALNTKISDELMGACVFMGAVHVAPME